MNNIENGIKDVEETARTLIEQNKQNITTNTAELKDIRVGADGTVYSNAGEAVRTQIADVKSDLSEIVIKSTNLVSLKNISEGVVISIAGTETVDASYNTSDWIPITPRGTYYFVGASYIAVYREDKSFRTRMACATSGKSQGFNSSDYYIRISSNVSTTLWQINEGDAPLPYETPGKVLSDDVSLVHHIDKELQTENKAADAKAVKDALDILQGELDSTNDILSGIYSETEYTDFVENSFINTQYAVGDTIDVTNTMANTTYCHLIIPVVAGHEYTLTGTTETGNSKRVYVLTDSVYKILAFGSNGVNYENLTLTPEEDGYLIFNAKKADVHSLSEYYFPIRREINDVAANLSTLEDVVAELVDGGGVVGELFAPSSNLATLKNLSENVVISSSGVETPNTSYNTSDYISVEPNETYYLKGTTYIAQYKQDKSFFKRVAGVGAGGIITMPSNVFYVRITSNSPTTVWQLNKGSEAQDYAEPDKFYMSEDVNIDDALEPLQEDINKVLPVYAVPFKPALPYHYTGPTLTPYTSSGHLADLYALYDALVEQYPQYIRKTVLGMDASNTYEMRRYIVDNGTNFAYRLPRIYWVSNIHGNEANSAITTYCMLKEILEKFATNPSTNAILSAVRLYVIPVANPWGYENYLRTNVNNVNLNRNFPVDWIYRDPTLEYGESKYGIMSAKGTGGNPYYYYGGGTVVYDDTTQTATTTYVMEQETRLIINDIVANNTGNNLNGKIMFAVNRHDAGLLSNEAAVFYIVDNFESDRRSIASLCEWLKPMVMQYQNWITEKNGINISTIKYEEGGNIDSAGTMDKWFNYNGLHGCLVEIPPSAGPSFTDTNHRSDLCNVHVEFNINLLAHVITNNEMLNNNTQTATYTLVEEI